MASENHLRTSVIVALIGLVGTLGAALIAIAPQLVGGEDAASPPPAGGTTASAGESTTPPVDTRDSDSTVEPGTEEPEQGDPPPPPVPPPPEPTTEAPVVGDCQITTTPHPGAIIYVDPDPFSQEIARVPAGTYAVLETTTRTFVGSPERWLLIDVSERRGWLEDTTMFIADKSAGCP